MEVCLNNIKVGDRGTVAEVSADHHIYKRLTDIGLIKGTDIECLQINAGRSLAILLVRGARFAFRFDDLTGIRYTPEPKKYSMKSEVILLGTDESLDRSPCNGW